MASSLEIIKQLEKHCECAICYEQLSNPRTLSCEHSFCKECLEDLIPAFKEDGSAEFVCPTCQKEHVLGAGETVHSLQTSLLLKQIIDSIKKSSNGRTVAVDRTCSLCTLSATTYCIHCHTLYCKQHLNEKSDDDECKKKTLRLAYKPLLSQTVGMCPNHECAITSCCLDCKKSEALLCKYCCNYGASTGEEHDRSHKKIDISNTSERLRKKLSNRNQELEQALSDFKAKYENACESSCIDIEGKVRALRKKVEERKMLILIIVMKQLNFLEDDIMASFKMTLNNFFAQLNNEKDALKSCFDKIVDADKELSDYVSVKCDLEVLMEYKSIEKIVNDAMAEANNQFTESSESYCFQSHLTTSSDKEMNNLANSVVQAFGNLNILDSTKDKDPMAIHSSPEKFSIRNINIFDSSKEVESCVQDLVSKLQERDAVEDIVDQKNVSEIFQEDKKSDDDDLKALKDEIEALEESESYVTGHVRLDNDKEYERDLTKSADYEDTRGCTSADSLYESTMDVDDEYDGNSVVLDEKMRPVVNGDIEEPNDEKEPLKGHSKSGVMKSGKSCKNDKSSTNSKGKRVTFESDVPYQQAEYKSYEPTLKRSGKRVVYTRSNEKSSAHVEEFPALGSNGPEQGAAYWNVEREQCNETSIQAKYKDFPGLVFSVMINKSQQGTGLNIASSQSTPGPTFVIAMVPGSPAHESGKIKPGDQILEVNGKNIYGFRQNEVSAILKDAPALVSLVIGRPEDSSSFNKLLSEALPKQKTESAPGKTRTRLVSKDIYLPKSESTKLGFSFRQVAYKDGLAGIFILEIAKDGVAFKDGRLKVNDQITAINNIPMRNISQKEALGFIRSSERQVKLSIRREEEVNEDEEEDEELDPRKIFVGGVRDETSSEEIIEYFSQYGQVNGELEYPPSGKKGFLFVTFQEDGVVNRILEASKRHKVTLTNWVDVRQAVKKGRFIKRAEPYFYTAYTDEEDMHPIWEIPSSMKKNLWKFLKDKYPDGIEASNLCEKLERMTGTNVRYPYFGHLTLKNFLVACSDVVTLSQKKEKMFVYYKPR